MVLPWLSGQPGEVSQLGDGDDGSDSYISPVSYRTGVSHATQTIPSPSHQPSHPINLDYHRYLQVFLNNTRERGVGGQVVYSVTSVLIGGY